MPKDRAADEPRRDSILDAGVNCWKKVAVRRAAFLVDGDSYYRAVADAIDGARRSIWILGWDTDSRVPLRREAGAPGLESFLRTKLEENPELTVHVLSWDFAMVYAFERELAPLFRLTWSSHERLHYHLDAHHPVGGCQHQKVVVIDDSVAFAGGFDLTKSRWDTSEHLVDEPRRSTPDGRPYPPFHDVQMAVDGDAARALGDLARERWYRATGERIEPPRDTDSDPWPGGLEADAENAVVGIARSLPPYDSSDPVREVERLHLDAIAAARDSIYIENQYFTSMALAEALCARLEEAEGPEVVAVVPDECPGWLEETTMGVLRNQCLLRLLHADRFGRFRVYHPVVGDVPVFVHSKVMVVDDRLARVGSANLSNRSMGLDSECDLALEAEGNETAAAVASLRFRLLAEHLGVAADRVAEECARRGSLVSAIEELRSGERTLLPVSPEEADVWTVATAGVADPERPIEPDLLIEDFLSKDSGLTRRLAFWRAALLLSGALALAALWQWGPLGDWLTSERLSQWASSLRNLHWALAVPVILAVYVVSGVLMVPLTLLIVATAATFGAWVAALYAFAGTMASGMVTFGVGHLLGRDALRRLAGAKLNRVSKKLARRGILAVATLRLLPLAPYGIVNMIAGASHIRFRDFIAGTFLGILPGIAAITLLASRIEDAIRNPGVETVLYLVFVLLILLAFGRWVRRRFLSENDRARA